MELIDYERSQPGIFESLLKESCVAIRNDTIRSGDVRAKYFPKRSGEQAWSSHTVPNESTL